MWSSRAGLCVAPRLAKSAELLTEVKGQVIFRQGDPGEVKSSDTSLLSAWKGKSCFMLVKGQVALGASKCFGQVTVHVRDQAGDSTLHASTKPTIYGEI